MFHVFKKICAICFRIGFTTTNEFRNKSEVSYYRSCALSFWLFYSYGSLRLIERVCQFVVNSPPWFSFLRKREETCARLWIIKFSVQLLH